MLNRILPYLWISVLLVSCDKQRGADDASADGSKPSSTRAGRTARQDQPGRQQDLRAALSEAKKIRSPEDRDRALLEVAHNALDINANIVAETLKYLSPDSPAKAALIKDMIARLLQADPDSVDPWVASLDAERDRVAARGAVAAQVATSDPAHAAQLLLDSGVTGSDFDRVAVKVVQNWSSITPMDAVVWGLKLPPGESRANAVKAVFSQWMQADTKAASAWVLNPANEANRKEATRYMAEALVNHPIGQLMVQQTEPALRAELERQMGELTGQPAGEANPPGEPQPEPAAQPQPEPQPEPAAQPQPETPVEPQPEPQGEPAPAPSPNEPTEPEGAPEDEAEGRL